MSFRLRNSERQIVQVVAKKKRNAGLPFRSRPADAIGVPSVSFISKSGMRSPMLLPILKSIADVTGATVGDGAGGSSEPQATASATIKAKQMTVNLIVNYTIPSSSYIGSLGAEVTQCPPMKSTQNRRRLPE